MTSLHTAVARLAALALTAALLAVPASSQAQESRATHIVRLEEPPLASYRGGLAGLPATNPGERGQTKLDVDTPASRAYLRHLDARHRVVEAAAEASLARNLAVEHDYRYAFNGFAVRLTDAEAATVRNVPGVAAVQRQYRRSIETDAGPQWIGAPGIWSGSAFPGATGTKGEGVVVGVIDTGINHDHPSFADVGGDGYDHENPRGQFYGLCEPVTGAPFCNDKLIGAWDFTGTTPNDDNGHGSHTASTSVGNSQDAVVNAPTLELERSISGVAPHANLITYKACLAIGSCLSPSLVAAIDQATADEVDVINYSIGGGPNDPWIDADAQAFLAARDAGVFVATSAGNSGPGPETVGSPADAPWVLGVGASTHDRAFINAVTDMSGGATAAPADITGKSFTSGYGPAPIVYAGDYGDELCGAPFPPGTFDGEIVICDRGVNPRVEKGRNVELGGAGGMVLANSEAEGESTVADPHELPAVNISFVAGKVLKDWVADGGEGHSATIAGTTADQRPANGDVMAGFSSRGPNKSVPSVIKPDISAPGVDILAAVHTTNPTAPAEYGLLSGTSMSSPHMAGSAALVRALRPEWSPAEVQSALMTTALNTTMRKEDASSPADAFDMGAGRVDLTKAGRAGLVLDESAQDYETANPAAGGDPSRLNLPSLGSNDCTGTCTWTRTVENSLDRRTRWTASTSAPQGMSLSVKPRRLTLNPGGEATITVTADVGRLAGGEWTFAQVDFAPQSGTSPSVHFPVAVLPGGAPQEVDIAAQESSGSESVTLTAPVRIKKLGSKVFGLEQGRVTQQQLAQDPTPLDPYDGLGGTFHITTEVAQGSRFLATEITETTSTDLDLFVGLDADGDGEPDASEEVCRSASETAIESCKLEAPEGGTYWIMVQNWLTGQGLDDVSLVAATIPGTDEGNLTVKGPGGVVQAGAEYDVSLEWDEPTMEPGTTWFALVQLRSDDRAPDGNAGSMFVTIERQQN
ncbi:MAG: S8 family serine peptidase [Actinomycetota bacterium]